MLHNPRYDFNDEVLPLGASYWANLVETRLAGRFERPPPRRPALPVLRATQKKAALGPLRECLVFKE
jgi:hypothetical protein